MKNFAATDFKIVKKCDGSVTEMYRDIRARDPNMHIQITNLIKDWYLGFYSRHGDGKVFLEHTNADYVTHSTDKWDSNENELTLGYDDDENGQTASKKIASVDILEGFAKAMNVVMPIAQQRAIDGMEKRYGVKALKHE